MERRDKSVYLYFGILILGALLVLYLFNLQLTGFAVLEQYTNESACVEAGHTWTNSTNQTCIDISGCVVCETGCVANYTETLCVTGCQQTCSENETGCVVCETGCVANYTETLCTSGCQESCQNCTDVVIGGQCTGNVCDSNNLNLCLDEATCTGAGGYWYNSACNVNAEEQETEEEEEEITENITEETEVITTVQVPVQKKELTLQPIETQTLNPSDSQNLNLIVKNTGDVPFTACKLDIGGNYSTWFSVPDSQNINTGEEIGFVFSMNVPENTAEGNYAFALSVQCMKYQKIQAFQLML